MPLSHKSILWSTTVGSCFSKLKIKDVALPMANENENLILVQKCLGRRNDFLLIKESCKWIREAMDLSVSFTMWFMYFSNSLPDLFLNQSFKTYNLLFITLFLFCSWFPTHTSFTLEREHAGCPRRQALWGQCGPFLILTRLVLIHPPHSRLFFLLIISPFMLCERLQQDFRIKVLSAATGRSRAAPTFETDCWLAVGFVL